MEQSNNAIITKEEQAAIKHDLLHFIHAVCYGEFYAPEHINALIPVFETIVKYFS